MNNLPSKGEHVPGEERNERRAGNEMEAGAFAGGFADGLDNGLADGLDNSSGGRDGYDGGDNNDGNDGKELGDGVTFNWLNFVLGLAIFVYFSSGGSGFFTDDWSFYPCLALVVVIHELGHVVMGKSFGCVIQEMQVFFLSFVSYKPKGGDGSGSWRDIRWSLGVLPLGGVTMFKSRKAGAEDLGVGVPSASSPYIEDKPAWQNLLISAGGVLFNIATFLIIYVALQCVSGEGSGFMGRLMVLSLVLAFLNILPIYPLDGGSIVFSLYEIVTGRKPSPGFTKACGWIGFIFIVLFFWVFPEWLGGLLNSVLRLVFG